MATLPAESIEAIVTDPPYELGFMGKRWDGTGIANDVSVWCEARRVLKPGGHLLAFGGTRTYHRLACAIEDAGFEIRDQLQWLYGSGFPKSHNLMGEWDGWGTALKPAHEPIVLARKPLIGTVAANVARYGSGALNIDGCRLAPLTAKEVARSGQSTNGAICGDYASIDWKRDGQAHPGRWPANVLLDGDAAAMLDAQSGERGGMRNRGQEIGYDDTGGASRFFYCAKASRAERNAGLDGMPERVAHDDVRMNDGGSSPGQTPNLHTPQSNHHPTVKPISLMRWLVRLVTPPGGTVLDPFLGSGTTGIACVAEAFAFIGIEQDADYLELARRRILHAQGPLFASVAD
jgi:hypothetical protein